MTDIVQTPKTAMNQIEQLAAESEAIKMNIAGLEDQIELLKARRDKILKKDLPELMTGLSLKKAETEFLSISVGTKRHGSWPKDEVKAAEAQKHLQDLGQGGALKRVVTLTVISGDGDSHAYLDDLLPRLHNAPLAVSETTSIHPQSLQKLVGDLLERGEPVEPSVLGVFVECVATVKEKKP